VVDPYGEFNEQIKNIQALAAVPAKPTAAAAAKPPAKKTAAP
jgi:hypothetical protein